MTIGQVWTLYVTRGEMTEHIFACHVYLVMVHDCEVSLNSGRGDVESE